MSGICIVLLLHEWEMPNFSYFHVIWHDMSECCNLACRTNFSRMWQYLCGYSRGWNTKIDHQTLKHRHLPCHHPLCHFNCPSNGSSWGLQSLLESFSEVKGPPTEKVSPFPMSSCVPVSKKPLKGPPTSSL
jgi:hypothetical protein